MNDFKEMSDLIGGSQESDYFPEEVIKMDGTMFVQQPSGSAPSPTCLMLCTEDYPGPYDFEIHLNGEPSGKGWLFSHTLNKLFISLNSSVNLSFKCNSFHPGLFIRAVAVYTDDDAFCEPVNRCVYHRSGADDIDIGTKQDVLHHVVRIEDVKSEYCYDMGSKRRSVRVPLCSPQPGTDWVNIAFKFMCKNSCVTGMNRRPIEVIFTLENINEIVYGRQKTKVRICSCPKRDKQKEEKDLLKKSAPSGKRRMETNSNSGGRTTKQRKIEKGQEDNFLVPVHHLDDYHDILDYAFMKLKRRLRIENREPTEIEADLLQKYEAAIFTILMNKLLENQNAILRREEKQFIIY
ncbi:hypothetical protein C0J52_17830 [Blattella germanica]|nr:hypothetical protein C0J52_17830 [Blattella germanica]